MEANMMHAAKRFTALVILIAAVLAWSQAPAGAISEELAKKCRAMALKVHPSARPGTKTGSQKAQQDYFRNCVAKEGKIEN
jgi:hypothetical protein